MQVGRKPMGSALVQRLEGSERAKLRLQVILDTLAGRLKIEEACQRLGIGEAMFHRVRTEVLEAALERLEPRPLGRPPRQPTADDAELAQQAERIGELEAELHLAEVRQELAQVLPHVVDDHSPTVKKTTCREPQGRTTARARSAARERKRYRQRRDSHGMKPR
jgi:hypothetical protein